MLTISNQTNRSNNDELVPSFSDNYNNQLISLAQQNILMNDSIESINSTQSILNTIDMAPIQSYTNYFTDNNNVNNNNDNFITTNLPQFPNHSYHFNAGEKQSTFSYEQYQLSNENEDQTLSSPTTAPFTIDEKCSSARFSMGNVQCIQLNMIIGPGNVQKITYPVINDRDKVPKNVYGAYLVIIEQPTNRIRYRYRSEKGSHGGLNGTNSSQMKKTYPAIKIENYHYSAPIYIRASLATNEDNPKAHVHKLMGRHCSDDGSCTLPVSDNLTTIFQNLGILFIGKKEVPNILYKRKLSELRAQNYSETLIEKRKEKLFEECQREAKDFNLNSVKICFEAFMLQNDALYPICPMIYSRAIANQKSPDSGELKIIRINRYSGCVMGGDEIYLLCEKVNKKEIKVRFFELDTEGVQQWEAFGNFKESDVHHQVAIVFRTPPYRNPNITKPAKVYLQLFRQRDGEYSEPRTFIYKPNTIAKEFNNDTISANNSTTINNSMPPRMDNHQSNLSFKRKKFNYDNASGNFCPKTFNIRQFSSENSSMINHYSNVYRKNDNIKLDNNNVINSNISPSSTTSSPISTSSSSSTSIQHIATGPPMIQSMNINANNTCPIINQSQLDILTNALNATEANMDFFDPMSSDQRSPAPPSPAPPNATMLANDYVLAGGNQTCFMSSSSLIIINNNSNNNNSNNGHSLGNSIGVNTGPVLSTSPLSLSSKSESSYPTESNNHSILSAALRLI